MRSLRFAIAVLAIGTLNAKCASADGVGDEIAALKRRIDALELQNESLQRTLSETSFEQSGPILDAGAPPIERDPDSVTSRIEEFEAHLSEHAAPCPADCDDIESDLHMTASWHHGLELKTKDADFRVHIGGRTQLDFGWFSVDENVQENINEPYEDGADFRRGRFRIDGTMYGTIDWAAEYDFFNSFDASGTTHTVTGPTDLWWTFREVPWVGNIRVGNQKPAIGFEHIVSSRFLPFMERSFNQDSFYGGSFNGFLPGISCFDNWGPQDLGTWNIGLFKPANNVFAVNPTDGDYATVMRITRLIWYEAEGASLFHVGGSALQQTTVDDRITFRTRDAIRTGLSVDWPVPASTGSIAGDDMQWLNGELAAVYGPWTFQSEYLVNFLHDAAPVVGNVVQPSVGTVMYHGGYVQVLCFLTGEHDNYNKANGAFDRVIPHRNFHFRRGCAAGPGAWQIGVRYNCLDLNDDDLDGGILHNVTCGLNWFLNPNMKVQFNYMMTDRDAALAGDLGDGLIHGWGIRVAHDF